MNFLEINGDYGEGGGQILRSSLSLSAILGQPIRLTNIRSGRRIPGLAAQHLTTVNAVAAITNAEVKGATLGSLTLAFVPQRIGGCNYIFDVADVRPSAGALSLVFQSIAIPLAYADTPSTVTLRGGTHVPYSPNVQYLQTIFIPTVSKFGFQGSLKLNRWGWYPKGGGEATARVQPVPNWRGVNLSERGALKKIRGISAVSNLPNHIAIRQRDQSMRHLAQFTPCVNIDLVQGKSIGQGTLVFLNAIFEHTQAGFFALGKRGKSAAQVADEACQALNDFLESGSAIDPHLADQLILPMALAKGESRFTTSQITRHLTTNIWLLQQFLPVRFEIKGAEGERGEIIARNAQSA
jgi:RNA 3'-terminal phosphate cyclase (ATP)